MTPGRPRFVRRLGWLRRRGWVVLASVVVVTAIVALASEAADPVYVGEAITVVPSGAGEGRPGSAGEANKLAFTYAGLIPQDGAVRARLQAALGDDADGDIVSFNDVNTALLRIRYEHTDRAVAVRGARVIAEGVTAPVPLSSAIAPGSLVLSRLPTSAFRKPGPTSTPGPIGVTLGLFLGAILVAAWERADPRVDDSDEAESVLAVPVTDLADVTPTSAVALLDRWAALVGSVPARVALVPVGDPPLHDVTRALVALGSAFGVRVALGDRRSEWNRRPATPVDDAAWNLLVAASGPNGGPSTSPGRGASVDLILVPAGEVGGDAAGEAIGLACDATVLVVRAGTRVEDARAAATTLAQFGVAVAWAVLASASSARRIARLAEQAGDAAEPAVGAAASRETTARA